MTETKPHESFLEVLKEDEVVQEYEKYAGDIAKTLDPKVPGAEVLATIAQMGSFPVLGHFGDGEVAIVHHFMAGAENPLTKKATHGRAIVGIKGAGDPVELKGFSAEVLGKGKVIKAEVLFAAAKEATDVTGIRTTSTSKDMRSFTFCPEVFFGRFAGGNDSVAAHDLMKWALAELRAVHEEDAGLEKAVKTHMEPLTWLVWAARGKTPVFPTRPLLSTGAKRWHAEVVALEITARKVKRQKLEVEPAAGDGNNANDKVQVARAPPKEKSAWDKLQGFTKGLFLCAGTTSEGTPYSPTDTLKEVLECKNSGLAVRLLRAKAGAEGRDFWLQPDLINSLRNGLIVAENLHTPEGLTPFLTPGCPDGLTLTSFEEKTSVVTVGGVSVSAAGRELRATHGKKGKAGFIIPENMTDCHTQLTNFKYLIYLIFGSESILYIQCAAAEKIVRRYMVDLRSMSSRDTLLPAKILWRMHLRVQGFLRACSEAGQDAVETTMLDWETELRLIGQGLGGGDSGILPPCLTKRGQHRDDRFRDDTSRKQSAVNTQMAWRFRHGEGRRLLDVITRRQAYPPALTHGRPCLFFHLRGSCKRGRSCSRQNSHRVMTQRDMDMFANWISDLERGHPQVPDGFPPGYRGDRQSTGRGTHRPGREGGEDNRRGQETRSHPNGRD